MDDVVVQRESEQKIKEFKNNQNQNQNQNNEGVGFEKNIPKVASIKEGSDANSLLGMDTVLLIICSDRPDYLERTLEYVVKYHPR